MLNSQSENLKSKIKTLQKNDGRWLEKLTSTELDFLASINGDLCQMKLNEGGKIRSVIKRECRNRYHLYALLRSKRRCPKNEHGETML
jgi:hypothetical protein